MILGIIFTITFTDVEVKYSFWVGLFSYLGADTIYKSLEGKLTSFRDLKPPVDENNENDKINSNLNDIEEIIYAER